MENLTAENLKDTLWDSIQGVKSGKMSIDKAQAMARASMGIIKTVGLQLKTIEYCQTLPGSSVKGFIGTENLVHSRRVKKKK